MYNSIASLIRIISIVKVLLLVCSLATSTPIRCHYGQSRENYCVTDNKFGWCASYLLNFRDRNNRTYNEVSEYSCESRNLFEHPFWCDQVRDHGAYLKAGTCRQHTFTIPNNGTVVSGIYCCCQKEFCNSAHAVHWHQTGFAPAAITDSPSTNIGKTGESYYSVAIMNGDTPTSTARPLTTSILSHELHKIINALATTVLSSATSNSSTQSTSTIQSTSSTLAPSSTPSTLAPSFAPSTASTSSTTTTPPMLLTTTENDIDASFPAISPTLLQAISSAGEIASNTLFKPNATIIPFPVPGPLPVDAATLATLTDRLPPFSVPKSSRDNQEGSARDNVSVWWFVGGGALLLALLLLSVTFMVVLCYWQGFLCFKPGFDVEHNPSYNSPPRVAKMLVTDIASCPTPRVWFNDDHQPSSISVSSIASSSGYTDRSIPLGSTFGTVKSML
uniref:Uncharacterized protein n=1 Tax=Plectus sambesii TaxID=2011161 RepID=A0A914XJM4_9BILA